MTLPAPDRLRLPSLALWAGLLGLALAAYLGALKSPFVFDDLRSIPGNPTLADPFSIDAWNPPPGRTVTGRPVLNVSFAINQALHGDDPAGYRATNLFLHACAGLVLFGLLRRIWAHLALARRTATSMAFAATALWLLHPVQTQAVTYIVQRAESLMALWYLLTLYCFARAVRVGEAFQGIAAEPAPATRVRWAAAAIVSCALGMATKETMVTAPIVVLLFDVLIVSGRPGAAGHPRWRVHVGLFATWVIVALLAFRSGGRGGTAGFDVAIPVADYGLRQTAVVLEYIWLTVWPHPLIFDHGEWEPTGRARFIASASAILVLLAVTLSLVRRRRSAGFALAAALLVLTPTSSVLPILTEPKAEHRLYLPLAAGAAFATAGLHAAFGRRGVHLGLVVAVLFAGLTWRRNQDYTTARRLWADTVAKAPANARARANLAIELAAAGDPKAAEREFRAAIRLRPDYMDAHTRLSDLLATQGRLAEAEAEALFVAQREPNNSIIRNALGTIHAEQGRWAEADRDFAAALALNPDFAEAHNNRGGVLLELGDLGNARTHFHRALELRPDYADAHYNLGNVFAREQRYDDARQCYAKALTLRPDFAAAHAHLGIVLHALGERDRAIPHYQRALELHPDFAFVRERLAELLLPTPRNP